MNKIVRTNLGIEESRLTKLDAETPEGISYLKKKLVEEATEVLNATSRKEVCEELGDLLEVIYSFYAIGFDKEYIDALRTVKCEEKGDFIETSYEPHDFKNYVYVLDKQDDL